jgi:hypothetical protein
MNDHRNAPSAYGPASLLVDGQRFAIASFDFAADYLDGRLTHTVAAALAVLPGDDRPVRAGETLWRRVRLEGKARLVSDAGEVPDSELLTLEVQVDSAGAQHGRPTSRIRGAVAED